MGFVDSISRTLPTAAKLRVVFITVLILTVPFFVYYIFYIKSQTDYFTNRNFRALARGKVAVSAIDDTGRARRLAILEDGDFFGETSLLTDSPTTTTVETLTPSTFLVLQREQLRNLMRRHEAIGAQVRHALERRAAETCA